MSTLNSCGALLLAALALLGIVVLAALSDTIPSALYAVLGVSVTGHLAGVGANPIGGKDPQA